MKQTSPTQREGLQIPTNRYQKPNIDESPIITEGDVDIQSPKQFIGGGSKFELGNSDANSPSKSLSNDLQKQRSLRDIHKITRFKDDKEFIIDLSKPNTYIMKLKAPDSPSPSDRMIQMAYKKPGSFSKPSTVMIAEKYNTDLAVSDKEGFIGAHSTCEVCDGRFSRKFMASFTNCNHLFCEDCLVNYIQSCINHNKVMDIGCLQSNCDSLAIVDKVCSFLNEKGLYELENKYRRFRNTNLALKWNKKLCPNEACFAMLEEVKEGGLEYGSCHQCKINVCLKCNNLLHPDKPCDQADKAEFKKYMSQNEILQCPKCGINIFKEKGCNHMTCIACRHQFCWICKKDYSPNHYSKFNPFGCPGMQFVTPKTGAVCCQRTKAVLFWIIIVLFFPVIYIGFLVSIPSYFYLKRQRNTKQEMAKKGLEYTPDSCCKRTFILPLLGILGIPFMVIALVLTVLGLPLLLCVGTCKLCQKCCKKSSREKV